MVKMWHEKDLSTQEHVDPAEQALFAEFGTYLQQIAQTFTKPVEISIRTAEENMLGRLQAHEAVIAANHAADSDAMKKRHAELHQLSSDLTSFLKEWRQSLTTTEHEFREFIRLEEERLKAAEKTSRTELTQSLTSVLEQRLTKLQAQISDTAAQAQLLQRQVGVLTTRTNFTLGVAILLLIVVPVLLLTMRH